jgi:hypothetical protein
MYVFGSRAAADGMVSGCMIYRSIGPGSAPGEETYIGKNNRV